MTLEKTYNRDTNTKLFTGISHQPAAVEKYWRALTVLIAESEQMKAMTRLDWMPPIITGTPTGKPKRGREEYNRGHQQPDDPSIQMLRTGYGEHIDRPQS